MSIITFWNDNTGKIGQTYSALAIASYMGVEHNYKILLISTRYDDQVTAKAFGVSKAVKSMNILKNNNQSADLASGIEGMMKLAAANRLTPEVVPDYTKMVYKNRLEFVPAIKKKPGLEYENVYKSYKNVLAVVARYYDLVFVDLNNGLEHAATQEILNMSNVVVLNIEQKLDEIEKLKQLKKNKELFPKNNTLSLINNYDKNSKYTSKNMAREIGEKRELLTVPYDNLFTESVQEGMTAEFFINTRLKRLDDPEDKTTFFINELKKDSEAIIYKIQELQMKS